LKNRTNSNGSSQDMSGSFVFERVPTLASSLDVDMANGEPRSFKMAKDALGANGSFKGLGGSFKQDSVVDVVGSPGSFKGYRRGSDLRGPDSFSRTKSISFEAASPNNQAKRSSLGGVSPLGGSQASPHGGVSSLPK